AIVTAMLGLFWLSWIGILDLSLVYVNPTYLLPQLVGGLVFGIGFVIGGLCPGTSCVASATGKIDGMVLLLGLFFGIFIFGELLSSFHNFLYSTSLGQITLPQISGIPHGIVLFFIVLLAIAGFIGAEVIEKKFSRSEDKSSTKGFFKNITLNKKLALLAVVPAIFATVVGNPSKTTITYKEAMIDENLVKYVDVQQLAEWIMDKQDNFSLIDLRSKWKFEQYHIPFAQNITSNSLANETVPERGKIIIYGQDETLPKGDWQILKDIGFENVYLLRGGLNEWLDKVIFPDLTKMGVRDENVIERIKKTSWYFGGKPKLREKDKSKFPKKYRREGC
ncbi:MAG: YeeE/YedE family protein, partial [bacterium]